MAEGTMFSDLVEEAFINPLRSVLIVDDEYPTWEEVLNSSVGGPYQNAGGNIKKWRTEPNGPLRTIKQFRDRNPGFIIDIHDGPVHKSDSDTLESSETPIELASHLHQSDLLVLDYNLEGSSSSLGGVMARCILQSVLANNHFNLVIVHTDEDDLDEVLSECLLSSMKKVSVEFDNRLFQKLKQLDEKLDGMEDEGTFDKGKLPDFFNIHAYIECRRLYGIPDNLVRHYRGDSGLLAPLRQWARDLDLKNGELRYFLYWAIREFEQAKSSMFASETHDGLRWHSDEGCKWLRTVRGFVVFVNKGDKDLLTELRNALESWKPTPSRLLSAKYRHELNRIGVEVEDRTLSKSYVFAHFYRDICNTSSSLRAAKLKEHVSRQSEAISFHIEDEVVSFGERIVKTDGDVDNKFFTYYCVDLVESGEIKKAAAHYNSYISTLPLKLGNDQLDSGHIFTINNGWWVCATPACDLQPNRTTIAFSGNSNDLRPFTALKLNEVNIEDLSPGHINSGEYCFIETKPGEIIALGLRALSDISIIPRGSKVTWRTYLAKDSGQIKDRDLKLITPKLVGETLSNEDVNAKVIAKLRYEYALNYIQKVGASVSRIGLGYTSSDDDN